MSEYRHKKNAEKFILYLFAISLILIGLEVAGLIGDIDTYLIRIIILLLVLGMLLYKFAEIKGYLSKKPEEKKSTKFSIFLDTEKFNERVNQLIAQSRRYSQEFSIICIGFDGLDILFPETKINTMKGIEYSLNSILRESDFLTHDPSGNILACLPMTYEKWDLTAVAEKIIYSLSNYFYIASFVSNVKANLGVARYPHSAADLEQLLISSENSMLESKSNGGNTFIIHS